MKILLYICSVLIKTQLLFCSNSPDEFAPHEENVERNLTPIWSLPISVDFNHKVLEAVQSLSGDMEEICAFFVPKS